MTQTKEKKDHCSVPLTACCPKKDIENVSMSNMSVGKDSMTYSERSSLIINGASSFQGPNVQIDLEFKDLSYDVKIKKNGNFLL